MPAERIDQRCNQAADSHETIDSKIYPIPSKQCNAAKDANNKKTEQKAAMQIDPQDHNCRQQKAPLSFQAFSVKHHGKQHGGNVWRGGEINIRVRLKGRVEQARG